MSDGPWTDYAGAASAPAASALAPGEAERPPWEDYDAGTGRAAEGRPWENYADAKAGQPVQSEAVGNAPRLIYGEPGGETLTEEEARAIEADAEEAFPSAQEPGRITRMPRSVREWGRFLLGGMLHPIRQAETAVEQTAIQNRLAQPGSRLLWSPAEAMEQPAFGAIPMIPQQEGMARQVGAGAVNTASGLINFLQTPEGALSLGLGKLPVTARRAVMLDWAGQMASSAPGELLAGAEAWKEGDYQAATQGLLSGTTGAMLSAALARHGLAQEGATFREAPERLELTEPLKTSEFEAEPENIQTFEPKLKEPDAITEKQQQGGVGEEFQGGAGSGPASATGDGNRLQRAATGAGEGGGAGAAELSATELKYLDEDLRARKPLRADAVERAQAGGTFALPEGYRRVGDEYVWEEPTAKLTAEQAAAREAMEAMRGLREQKTAEEQTAEHAEHAEADTIDERTVPSGGDEFVEEPPGMAALPELPVGPMPMERPPDILDWIADNYPRGVKPTSWEDYGHYVTMAKGAARELMGKARGESADRVLKELHDQGMYRRIGNEDELLSAMSRAGEARIAWRQNLSDWQKRMTDLEAWADRTIREGQGRLHAGLDPELLSAYAVKGAYVIARGARDFAAWSAEMVRQFGEALRPHLQAIYGAAQRTEIGQRQAAVRESENPKASEPVRAEVRADIPYEVRHHADLDAEAQRILQEGGPDQAFELFRNPNSNLPLDLRERVKQQLLKTARAAEAEARAQGNHPAERAAQQRQVDLWRTDVYGTELAQGLSARQTNTGMSAGAHLRQAREMFGDAGQAVLDRVKPAMDVTLEELRRGNAEGLEGLKRDEQANGAARTAVDEGIGRDAEVRRGVVMELTGPWTESKVILDQARAAVRAKANELLNVGPRPPGLTPAARLREILDDLAKRAAGIAAGHYQGAEAGRTLTSKLQERLGLGEEAAGRLAKALDAEFAAQMKKAAQALPKRIARQRVRQNQGLPENPSDPVVDQVIRRKLRESRQRLDQLVRQHGSTVDEAGRSIGERILADSGLTGPKADELRAVIDRRFAALADAAKRRRLDALANGPMGVPGALRRQFGKLLEWTRLGAFDDARLREKLRAGLGLKVLTDDIAREIVRRSNQVDKLPEGFLRDREATKLLNWIAQQAGTRLMDIPMGMFYSNILSGLTTSVKIPFENMGLLVGNTLVGALRGKLGPVSGLKAFGRGAVKGALQSAEVMRSGIVTGVKPGVRPSSVMELKPFGEGRDWFNYWKWFGREIAALHVSTFKPAWEIKQQMMAQELAKSQGLRGAAAQQRALELLSLTDEQVSAAEAQAWRETRSMGNLSKLDWRRRVMEIVEQNRERSMPGSTEAARDFALRTTYLNKPYGFLGFVAEQVRTGIERAKAEYPWLGRATKSQIPFTTVVANILNEKLNWTPMGAVRAAVGQRTGNLYGRPLMERGEIGELYVKSMLGTALLGGLGTLGAQFIHGSGPASPQHRRELQAAGWVPNSIGPIGGRYYSYVNTPAAAGLAWLGNWLDYKRYRATESDDAEARAAYSLKAMGDVVIQQGMLDGLRRIFEVFGDPSASAGGAALEKSLARTAGSFVTPNLVMQLDKLWDPTLYDQTGIKAALLSQVPIARRAGRPVLNALGEPVAAGPFDRWTHSETKDPLWRAVVAQQAWIPMPPRDVVIGNKAKGEDYWRTLTPDEWYDYVAESGQDLRDRLDPDRIMDLEPEQARAYVRRVTEQARERARKQFGL